MLSELTEVNGQLASAPRGSQNNKQLLIKEDVPTHMTGGLYYFLLICCKTYSPEKKYAPFVMSQRALPPRGRHLRPALDLALGFLVAFRKKKNDSALADKLKHFQKEGAKRGLMMLLLLR